MTSSAPREKLPRQIAFLAWNEAAERFSYYGMTSILALHMARNLGFAENEAVAAFQIFTFAVYFMPMIGAFVADRFWGRYRTILVLSLGYVAGHATLAAWESRAGLVAGLALIAIGAGGIKPCASAFAGDQVVSGDRETVSRVYDLYYWMINLGSTASTILIPLLLDHVSARAAFGVPGLAMAAALLVFWVGRRRYVKPPPVPGDRHGFFRVAATALARRRLDAARGEHPADAVDGVRAVLRISSVFAPCAIFWALFFQYGSSWTFQAEKLDRVVLGLTISAGQVSTLNALFVLSLIPVFALWIYPAIERRGVRVTPLGKMTVGMFVTVLSFVAAAFVQAAMDRGPAPNVAWQVPQYLFLSVGEVLVSVTALEFAYTQAPARMKSAIMGLWYVTIAAGSLLTALVAWLNRFQGVAYFGFFAALMLGAAFAFALVARRYRRVQAAPQPEPATGV